VVAHLHRGLPVGHSDVHVAAAHRVLGGQQSEVPGDALVAIGVGDRLLGGPRQRNTDRQQLPARLQRRNGGDRPRGQQMCPHFPRSPAHRRGALHLHARDPLLGLRAEAVPHVDHLPRHGERNASGRIDDQELFLDAQRRLFDGPGEPAIGMNHDVPSAFCGDPHAISRHSHDDSTNCWRNDHAAVSARCSTDQKFFRLLCPRSPEGTLEHHSGARTNSGERRRIRELRKGFRRSASGIRRQRQAAGDTPDRLDRGNVDRGGQRTWSRHGNQALSRPRCGRHLPQPRCDAPVRLRTRRGDRSARGGPQTSRAWVPVLRSDRTISVLDTANIVNVQEPERR
jgi:hypothetical protein